MHTRNNVCKNTDFFVICVCVCVCVVVVIQASASFILLLLLCNLLARQQIWWINYVQVGMDGVTTNIATKATKETILFHSLAL